MTSETAWPSYYIKEHINNVAGMLKGVKEINLKSEGEVEILISDNLTKESLYNLFGNITRGVRITYIMSAEK